MIGFPAHAVIENAIPKKLLHKPITIEWCFSEDNNIIIIGAVTTIPKWETPSNTLEINTIGKIGFNACINEIKTPNNMLIRSILFCVILELYMLTVIPKIKPIKPTTDKDKPIQKGLTSY